MRIKDKYSNTRIIDTGVPQGTILGPLFFILYVNDLLLDMQKDSILSYADDTVIISDDETWSLAQDKMNVYLEKVANWLLLNKLSLNTKKTVFMTFGNYCISVPREIDIIIQNQKIERVENFKYLGIIFDYNMKWGKHIEYLVNRTKYLIYIFAKLKKIMDTKTLMKIYFAMFHSIITYGIIAWGGAYKTILNQLQNVQTRLLKIINKNKFHMERPMKINQLFIQESLIYHYVKLRDLYLKSSSKTRLKNIILPRMKKTISDKNSYITAIKAFNELPNELKNLSLDLKTIKNKIKKIIVSG